MHFRPTPFSVGLKCTDQPYTTVKTDSPLRINCLKQGGSSSHVVNVSINRAAVSLLQTASMYRPRLSGNTEIDQERTLLALGYPNGVVLHCTTAVLRDSSGDPFSWKGACHADSVASTSHSHNGEGRGGVESCSCTLGVLLLNKSLRVSREA